MGFTEKEFDYAESIKIPIMSFVCEDIGKLASKKCEQTDKGRELLKKFREKVCSGRLVNYYSDIGGLKVAVATSINKCIRDFPAVGWVRGNEIFVEGNENSQARFDELLKERIAIEKEINARLQKIESKPSIHIGETPPSNHKDLWIKPGGKS